LQSVPLASIQDWDQLSSNLQSLAIYCGFDGDFGYLFHKLPCSTTVDPTQDNTPGLPWGNLRYLVLVNDGIHTLPDPVALLLTTCVRLSLTHNRLDVVPESLRQLVSLQALDLSFNTLSSVANVDTTLGNITHLSLRGNQLRDLTGLYKLWALEVLDVRDNQLESRDSLVRLVGLPQLRELWLAGNPYHTHPECCVLLFFTFQAKGRTIRLDGRYPTPGETSQIKQLFSEYDDPEITPLVNGAPSTNSISHRVLPPSLVQHTQGVPTARPVRRTLSINQGSESNPLHATPSALWTSHRQMHKSHSLTQSPKATAKDKPRIAGVYGSTSLAEPSTPSHQSPPSMEPMMPGSIAPSARTMLENAGSKSATRQRVLRLAELAQLHKPLASSSDDRSTPSSSPAHCIRSQTQIIHPSSPNGTPGMRTQSLYAPTPAEPNLNFPARRTSGVRLGSSPDSVSFRGPTTKFRQRIEAMRSQAGSTWLKVFQEMQTAPGRDRESFQNEILSGEGESCSTEPSTDDPVSTSLPEFLFPQSVLSHRPPLPPRIPSLQTPLNTELERVLPGSNQSKVTKTAVTHLEGSAIDQPVTSPFHSEETIPTITSVSAKDESATLPPVAATQPSLLPSHAMVILVSVAQYDYLPDQGLFSGKPRAPPVTRWLAFVPAPHDADALPDYMEENPALLEFGSDGGAQLSEELARIPLHQVLTVVTTAPEALHMMSASSLSDISIILDLKASQYERPIRVVYTIKSSSTTSADGCKSGHGETSRPARSETGDGNLQDNPEVTARTLIRTLQRVRDYNWQQRWAYEVCKQARCLRCSWSGFIEPPASFTVPSGTTAESFKITTTLADNESPQVGEGRAATEPSCPQCHSTFLVEYYQTDGPPDSSDQTSTDFAPVSRDVACGGEQAVTDIPLTSGGDVVTNWMSPLASFSKATARAATALPSLTLSPFGGMMTNTTEPTTEGTVTVRPNREHAKDATPESPPASVDETQPKCNADNSAVTHPTEGLPHLTGFHGASPAISLPLQGVTNSLRLYLGLEAFQDPDEKLLMWIPTSCITQQEPFYTLETVTRTASESRWGLLSWASFSPPVRNESSASPSQVSLSDAPIEPWPPHIPEECTAEEPIFLALSNHRIYLLNYRPTFYTPWIRNQSPVNSAELARAWKHAEQAPGQVLQLRHAIDFPSVKRIDVGPNRQYLTFHFRLRSGRLDLADMLSGTQHPRGHKSKPSTGPTFPHGPESTVEGDANPRSLPTQSKVLLIRDRLQCSDFLNTFVVQCYEANVHLTNGKVRVVNHDVEWAIHNLRDTVFLRAGICGPQGSSATPSNSPSLHPVSPFKTHVITSLPADQRRRLTSALQSVDTRQWVDPASGDDIVVDKVTFDFLKMYYLVGWVAKPDQAPAVLRTCTFVASHTFFYTCDERLDVWPPPIPQLTDLYHEKLLQQPNPSVLERDQPREEIPTPEITPTSVGSPQISQTKSKGRATMLAAHRVPQYRPLHHIMPIAALATVTSGRCTLLASGSSGEPADTIPPPLGELSSISEVPTKSPVESTITGATAAGWTRWVTLGFKRTESSPESDYPLTGTPYVPFVTDKMIYWQLLFTTNTSSMEFLEALRSLGTNTQFYSNDS
ncbi:hypothetical protein IWQ61_009317, partial [Dispira simplex]